jgi:hypothetical protein
MARRKRTGGEVGGRLPVNRELVVLGDVRTVPVTLKEKGGQPYQPDAAVWIHEASGMVYGFMVGPPGQRAQLLAEALFSPGPAPFGPRKELPGQVVLFDERLAGEFAPLRGDPQIEIYLSEPDEGFDDLFNSLFQYLDDRNRPESALPDEALRPLCAAAARLWRLKPWQFMYDQPPVELVELKEARAGSVQAGAGQERPLYACVLGANEELFGVAFYTSLDDYRRFREIGEGVLSGPGAPAGSPPAAPDAAELLSALQRRCFLVSFDDREDLRPEYLAQLERNGWPAEFSVAPQFAAVGGQAEPGELEAGDAARIALAIEALARFCERHEDAIAAEAYEDTPIQDTISVRREGKVIKVQVRMPGE